MAYFPFFVNIAGKKALVAGGGKVAARKVKTLLDFGANVKVVSPEAVPELRKLAESGTVCLFLRKYRPEDLNSAALVIAATGDKEVNRQISRGAQEKLIPVNAVDNPELCTFFFPAVVRRGDFAVGITTSGSYPSFARYARQKIESLFPASCGEMIASLSLVRKKVRREISDPDQRRKILNRLLEQALQAEQKKEETGNGNQDGRD